MRIDAEREAWRAMRSLVLDHNDRKRDVSAALGMSFIRIKALRHLAGGPLAMRDLSVALSTDASYTTHVVDDLEARGLVVRAPHPDDRRAKIVSSTAQGRRCAAKAESILATPPVTMRGLSDQDLIELQRMLAVLLG